MSGRALRVKLVPESTSRRERIELDFPERRFGTTAAWPTIRTELRELQGSFCYKWVLSAISNGQRKLEAASGIE